MPRFQIFIVQVIAVPSGVAGPASTSPEVLWQKQGLRSFAQA